MAFIQRNIIWNVITQVLPNQLSEQSLSNTKCQEY